MIILIMGLPGAGKTTLAAKITEALIDEPVVWLNADVIREQFADWDFTVQGRLRQAQRIRDLADKELSKDRKIVVIDMVAPLPEMRRIVDPDLLIWCNTIDQGRFEDTNKLFVPPDHCDVMVTEKDAAKWMSVVLEKLNERKI